MSDGRPLLHAAYNFAPLSGYVHPLPEGERVSRDVPFRQGLNGDVEIEIEATTPLCVGGERDEAGVIHPFTTVEGELAIHGTSIKGMIRNVLEIATFSKMQFVDRDRRYAVRDLRNRKLYTDHMTETTRHDDGNEYEPKTRAGWLERGEDSDWWIVPCKVARVEQSLILEHVGKDTAAGKQLRKCFTSRAGLSEKYGAFDAGDRSLDVDFERDGIRAHKMSSGSGKLRFSKVTTLSGGSQRGTLVMTGQPSPNRTLDGRSEPGKSGKHREFVFHTESDERIVVPSNVVRDFELNHSSTQDQRKGGVDAPNAEWKFWRPKERVPVFYLTNVNSQVTSLGLTQMYRLAYKLSIGDAIDNSSLDHDATTSTGLIDFADGIFGFVGSDDAAGAARGRADFSVFLGEGEQARVAGETYRAVLGGPKPTFYPAYIDQSDRKLDASRQTLVGDRRAYTTLMDCKAELRGWKRYPARGLDRLVRAKHGGTDKVTSRWKAVDAGATFTGRMRVHNLRPLELGALLWALDFGGRPALRHRLGFAKPLGFGEVRLRLKAAALERNDGEPADLDECREAFIGHMSAAIPDWERTEQLVQLLAMADPQRAEGVNLDHPTLDGERGGEFALAKERWAVLPPYVRFDGTPDRKRFPRAERDAARRDRERQAERERAAARRRDMSVEDRVRSDFAEFVGKGDPDTLERLLTRVWEVPEGNPAGAWIEAVATTLVAPLDEMRRIIELADSGPPDAALPKKKRQKLAKLLKRAPRCRRLLAWIDGGYVDGPLVVD
jgi:CRISPR-associated protein (TIGR03986 family)